MSASNNAAVDLSLIAKLLTKAGHHGTPDMEALNAARKAYEMISNAGQSIDSLLRSHKADQAYQVLVDLSKDMDDLSNRLDAERRRARTVADERDQARQEVNKLKRQLREERRETRDLRAENARLKAAASTTKPEPMHHVTSSHNWTEEAKAQLVAQFSNDGHKKPEPVSVNEALQQQMQRSIAPTLEMFKKKAATKSEEVQRPETMSAPTATGVEGLIASLSVLANELGRDARLKTVLAYLHAATSNGIGIKELSGLIQGVSENSLRYGLRSLGKGWKQRRGLGLVADCAASSGGRARAYVATPEGRAVLNEVLAALDPTAKGRPPQPEVRFAA